MFVFVCWVCLQLHGSSQVSITATIITNSTQLRFFMSNINLSRIDTDFIWWPIVFLATTYFQLLSWVCFLWFVSGWIRGISSGWRLYALIAPAAGNSHASNAPRTCPCQPASSQCTDICLPAASHQLQSQLLSALEFQTDNTKLVIMLQECHYFTKIVAMHTRTMMLRSGL